MFNLYQIVTGAQGGQALDNLARQFGLSREQADSAVKALVPALSTAFMTKAAQPGGLNAIAGAMADDQHRQAYASPDAAQDASTAQKGGDLAGSIFGNSAILDQVVAQAAKYTGIAPETIRAMLPVVVSVVVGGVATAMHNQGLGGLFGQLANSGFGSMFGQGQGGAAGQSGGLGGMLGNVLGGMFGGAHPSASQPAQPYTPPSPQPPSPDQPSPDQRSSTPNPAWPQNPAFGGLPPAMQAGMEALGKMFQPGVHPTSGQPHDLSEQISSILSDKKG